ncbi:MAG: small multi-drug export protein [Phycisphaerae bacterium]|nr:small multi-drug export protein [Phycisphaerae bacterium]
MLAPTEPRESTPSDQHSLLHDESRFGDQFRRDHPLIWLVTLVAPFAATVAVLAVLAVVQGVDYVQRLVATAFATFFFFGRFVILGGTAHAAADEGTEFFSRGELFAMVVWMDLAVAMLVVYHASFIYRIPFLGPRLLGLVEDGQVILGHQRWIRRATFIGLVAFVLFPLAATGSVGGSIFGRLLGLSRWAAFTAIALGSVLGGGAMYLGAGVINRYLDRDNPWLTIGGIAVVAAIILVLNWRYRKLKQRTLANKPQQ